MRLTSDFRDWYDHAFDGKGETFVRMSRSGPSRREMFALLEGCGIRTPPHGTVTHLLEEMHVPAQLRGDLEERLMLVVYTDESAHRGEGKTLVSAAAALRDHPACYCSAYVAPAGNPLSYRYLRVGSEQWWVRYDARSGWRSNTGEGDTILLGRCAPIPRLAALPGRMLAIDFVVSPSGLMAVDLNIAPGLTPLRDMLTADEVVVLIEEGR